MLCKLLRSVFYQYFELQASYFAQAQKYNILKEFPIGEQIFFENKIEEWRNSIGIPYLVPSGGYPNIVTSSACSSRTSSVCSQPPSSPEPPESVHITLTSILEKKSRGKLLTDFYNENNMFQEKQRNLLIDLVAHYFVDENISLSLSKSHRLEKEIVERFPNEQLEFYRVGRRGKLYMKYYNMKRSSKSLETKKKVNSPEVAKKIKLCPEETAESCIQSLKFDNLTMEEFDSIWQACSQYRLNEIMDETNQAAIFLKWPYYKKPNGYRLIDKDFRTLYPEGTSILTSWDTSFKKLRNFLLCNLKDKGAIASLKTYDDQDCNKDAAILCLMNSIHSYLFPTKPLVQSNKIFKRYTIKDPQQAFLFKADSTQQLDEHIHFLKSKGVPVQPLILALGTSEYYLYIDNFKLKFNNLLRAIDICLKSFFVFNLKYPSACETFWKTIEVCFYLKDSKIKQCSAKMCILLAELNKD